MTRVASIGEVPLHYGIAKQLGIEIIDGIWPPDEARTLEEIQEAFGVSRTVAREVSRHLEQMGMVQIRRRIGLNPLPMPHWNVLNPQVIDWRLHSSQREHQIRALTQLRLAVEPMAAHATAHLASIHTRALLLPLAAEMRRTGEAGDLVEFMKLDIDFHTLILKESGNELFAALGDVVSVVLQGRTELGLMPERPKPEALAAHEAVAEAVFRGDGEGAQSAMEVILVEVREAFGTRLDGDPANN